MYENYSDIPPLIRDYIETISNERLEDIPIEDINGLFLAMEEHDGSKISK